LAERALDADRSAVRLDDLANNQETEAGPFRVPRTPGGAGVTLKQQWEDLGLDPGTAEISRRL
jgi:hypothetical protein